MADFIEQYLDFTTPMETPESFFRWACFSLVGALLRDNVYIRYGAAKLYPNTYILLLADPAGHRKGTPFFVNERILSQINNTKFIRGRTTMAGLLQVLCTPKVDPKTAKQINGGSCLLLAEELDAFLVKDPEIISRLTDLYDPRPEWTDNLRSGSPTIRNLCLGMLAASNETNLKNVYGKDAIFGGLLRRTFFVKPSTRKPPNSLFGEEVNYDDSPLVETCKLIADMRGEVVGDDNSIKKYREWYKDLYNSYGKSQDRTGVVESMHTSVLKIGMIICIARRQSLILEWADIEEAIDLCIELIPNYGMFSMSSGQSPNAKVGSLLFTEILESPDLKVSKKMFLRKNWNDVDSETLSTFVSTVLEAGLLEIDTGTGGEEWYVLTDAGKEKFAPFLQKDKEGA